MICSCGRPAALVYHGKPLCWACEDQRRLREGTTPDLSRTVPTVPRRWWWLAVVALTLWAGYCVVVAVS